VHSADGAGGTRGDRAGVLFTGAGSGGGPQAADMSGGGMSTFSLAMIAGRGKELPDALWG